MREFGETLADKYDQLKEIRFNKCYSCFLLLDIFQKKRSELNHENRLTKVTVKNSMVLDTNVFSLILSKVMVNLPHF
jgi:hypothetical protein